MSETAVSRLSAERSLVEQWVKKEYPKIHALVKWQNSEILFEDESGVSSDLHSGTTWAPNGKTSMVRVTSKRFNLNMISADQCPRRDPFQGGPRRGQAGVFIDFLKTLIHRRRRSLLLRAGNSLCPLHAVWAQTYALLSNR